MCTQKIYMYILSIEKKETYSAIEMGWQIHENYQMDSSENEVLPWSLSNSHPINGMMNMSLHYAVCAIIWR